MGKILLKSGAFQDMWQEEKDEENNEIYNHPNFKSVDPHITTGLMEFTRNNYCLGRMLKNALRNQDIFIIKQQCAWPEEEENYEPKKKRRRYYLRNNNNNNKLPFFTIQIQCIDRLYYIDYKTNKYDDSIKYFETGVRVDYNDSPLYVVLRGEAKDGWDIDFLNGTMFVFKDVNVFIKYYAMENKSIKDNNKQDCIEKQIKDDEMLR